VAQKINVSELTVRTYIIHAFDRKGYGISSLHPLPDKWLNKYRIKFKQGLIFISKCIQIKSIILS